MSAEKKYNVVDSFWFTNNRGTVGLVLTQNEMGVKKIRIGSVPGFDQKADEQWLAAWGARFPKEGLLCFINQADE